MPLSSLTGTRIRQRRGLIGLRQTDLARAAGISASYLNLIEHNRRKVAGGVLRRIAGALGVEVSALTGGSEAGLLDDLREAAAAAAGEGRGELEAVEEFASRFPGWAGVVAGQRARLSQLERAVEALSDRMSHDPHLSAALHEVLSAAAAVRSTAAILADTPDIEPGWRQRFQRNLADDSARLAGGAEALVAFLDGAAAEETGIAAPQEELEAWLAARGWHVGELENPGVAFADRADDAIAALIAAAPELATRASRRMAEDWLREAWRDARALPVARMLQILADAGVPRVPQDASDRSAERSPDRSPDGAAANVPDPVMIARATGVDAATVLRRLATLPQDVGPIGLVVCDGSGTLVFRKPLPGFGLPRFGAACPLWPLYQALSRPAAPIRARVAMPGATGVRFLTYALCQPDYPEGVGGPAVLRAYMLILPDRGQDGDPLLPVGTSCRICPRRACAARREPAIVAEGV